MRSSAAPKAPDLPSASAQKALLRYLRIVEKNLWGLDPVHRRNTLRDLRRHVVTHAMKRGFIPGAEDLEAIVATLGPPEKLGSGARAVYGYGRHLRGALLLAAFVIAIGSAPGLGPLSAIPLVVCLFLVTLTGAYGGARAGMEAGVGAATGRLFGLLLLPLADPVGYVLGPSPGLAAFGLVTVLLAVPGLITGLVHQREVRLMLSAELADAGSAGR